MDKTNKIFLTIIIFCTLSVIGICTYAIMNHENEVVSDAQKFKEEYEALNETVIGEYVYRSLDISTDNPIIYKTGKEVLDVLKNESAIVYFGFAACPWCRSILPTLLEVAEDEEVETIYYVDIQNIRDEYKFTGSIIPEKTKEGTIAYQEIIEFFGKNLDKYYVSDEKGNRYDTGTTRLYAPTVISVKNGEIKKIQVNNVESYTNPFVEETKEQKEELKKIYQELFNSIEDGVCTDEGC